jgi:hypothetical protein
MKLIVRIGAEEESAGCVHGTACQLGSHITRLLLRTTTVIVMLPLRRQHRLLSSHTRILAHLSPSVQRTILRHDLRRAASTSTVSLDPVIRGFASELGEKQPCFAMPARNVQILSEPQVFYDSLLVSVVTTHAHSTVD